MISQQNLKVDREKIDYGLYKLEDTTNFSCLVSYFIDDSLVVLIVHREECLVWKIYIADMIIEAFYLIMGLTVHLF